jgi:hypothetical protein
MAATNLDAQGGFVAAANMMEGAHAVAGATLGEPDVVDLLDGAAAHVKDQMATREGGVNRSR